MPLPPNPHQPPHVFPYVVDPMTLPHSGQDFVQIFSTSLASLLKPTQTKKPKTYFTLHPLIVNSHISCFPSCTSSHRSLPVPPELHVDNLVLGGAIALECVPQTQVWPHSTMTLSCFQRERTTPEAALRT